MGVKYIEKLVVQLLNLQNRKARTTPELALEDDSSAELEGEKRSNFATAVAYFFTSAQTGQMHSTASVSWQANW